MENKIVEITTTEQNKEKKLKELKELRTVSEPSGTTLDTPTFKL